jgi:hypothetical protein
MTTHASPQCAKPEVSPASSPEEHELHRNAAAPFEGDKQEQKNVADNQAPDQSPDIDGDEYSEHRRRFDSLKRQLMAEWSPTGLSEELAVLELVGLYWHREKSDDRICIDARSNPQNKNTLEEIMKLPPEQQEDAICSKLLQIGLTITPQERMENNRARFDLQIRQKIEWITFLKTTKRNIFDSSEPESVAVQRPRGTYRERWRKPQEEPTQRTQATDQSAGKSCR